jgi:hypothetical protein
MSLIADGEYRTKLFLVIVKIVKSIWLSWEGYMVYTISILKIVYRRPQVYSPFGRNRRRW